MNKAMLLLSFVSGACISALVTHQVTKQKYEGIMNDEIDAVINHYKSKEQVEKVEVEPETEVIVPDKEEKKPTKPSKVAKDRTPPQKQDIVNYNKVVAESSYNSASTDQVRPTKKNSKKKEEVVAMDPVTQVYPDIYTISPDEFNTLDGFDMETFYYTSDNYVLDSDYNALSEEDIVRTIGHDPHGNFGEYEPDSVYVRNERLACDYEILLSAKTRREISEV